MSTYNDFFDIIKRRKKNTEELENLLNDASVAIYVALIYKTSAYDLIHDLKRMVRLSNLPEKGKITAYLSASARKALNSKGDPYDIIGRDNALDNVRKIANEAIRAEESNSRDEIISEALKAPKNAPKDNIDHLKCFLLASRHDDCAEDHLPYQGKLYVKAWALRYPEVRKIVDERGIKTAEWVVKSPAWLCTRPNCRHFFTEITLGEVKGNSTTVLLKSHGMNRAVGTRSTHQNIAHSTRKEWYREENIVANIKKYKSRLKKHQKMQEVATNINLDNAVNHDKFMVRKWEQYLKKIKKER